MFILNQTPAEYDFGGSRTRLVVPGEHTGGAWCMLEIFAPAGRATPVHRHEREDETLILLSGDLEVVVDGTPHHLHPGENVVLGRGTTHQFVNRGATTAHYLLVCSPAGFDRFVETCSDTYDGAAVPAPPTDASKTRMREAASRFGIVLIPPPAQQ
ncbi:cupin domain-containing protein [Burkholderia pyrrocinia]|uniref:cupin domain-containing protein n=1 Tax=Burkholderia pyrrocinia TaxID=60550 RepID=UPI000B1133A9|nr:cupin domain-containing protein [Burkholderia pyrrocinia]